MLWRRKSGKILCVIYAKIVKFQSSSKCFFVLRGEKTDWCIILIFARKIYTLNFGNELVKCFWKPWKILLKKTNIFFTLYEKFLRKYFMMTMVWSAFSKVIQTRVHSALLRSSHRAKCNRTLSALFTPHMCVLKFYVMKYFIKKFFLSFQRKGKASFFSGM